MSTPTHEGYWMRVSMFGGKVNEFPESVYELGGVFVYNEYEANGAKHVVRADERVWLGPLVVDDGEAVRLRAKLDRLTEQAKQDAVAIDGFAGDLERRTKELTSEMSLSLRYRATCERLRDSAEAYRREYDEAIRFVSTLIASGSVADDTEACWLLFGIETATRIYGKDKLAWVHEHNLGPGGDHRSLYENDDAPESQEIKP